MQNRSDVSYHVGNWRVRPHRALEGRGSGDAGSDIMGRGTLSRTFAQMIEESVISQIISHNFPRQTSEPRHTPLRLCSQLIHTPDLDVAML